MTGLPSRRARRALTATVAVLLVSGASLAYLRQGATVVTVDDALEQFRAASTSADAADGAAAPAAGDSGAAELSAAANGDPVATSGSDAAAVTAAASPGATALQVASAPAPEAAAAPVADTAAPAQAASRVAEGVYTYTTAGYEATDAVGGARHDYPSDSAITVRHNQCGGSVQRWQPLSERWDESDLCVDAGGTSIRKFTTFHEFFKQRQTQEFECPPGTYVYRRAAAPGESWKWTCKAGSSTFNTTVTFIGIEDISIGGETRRAARLFYDSTMTGANRGTQKQERWVDPDSGLLFKMQTDIVTEADSPFGAVNYEEHYVLTLTSVTPRT